MKTRKFTTNINCDTCVRNVMPYLNGLSSVTSWGVETTDKEKILTVRGNFKDEEIEQAVKDAGFQVLESN
ncbi:MAG: hypothetical protein WD555_06045 [Fulvivirga sp.]